MSIDRSKRIYFEQHADLYDQTRPGYPEELIENILSLSDIPASGRILEIGCGPGNATIPFARRGYHIVAIELGERLAALAAKNCLPYPKVEIRNASFEDSAVEERAYDLAISADAFHWIPPEIGYPKIAGALKDSGSVALFWNIPVGPQTEWSRAIDSVYREVALGVENPDKSITLEWVTGVIKHNFAACGCFQEVAVKTYRWSETYSTDRYLNLVRTYSSLASLDAPTRSRLFAGIRGVLEDFGGWINKPFLAALFHARVKR